MNTPAHLIFGMAAFGKPASRAVTLAALAGALLPDLSLYVMAGVSLFILQIDPRVVFDELYFSDAWQLVFKIDNSFVLWGLGLALALWRRSAWGIALCGAALLHLALDFPLHHDDGRAHFWPITDWIYQSPFSYWDRAHHAGIIAPIEAALCFIAGVWVWRRYSGVTWAKVLIVTLVALQLAPVIMWTFIFDRA
ncbi:cobalamin biosynthesis protein CobQ [Nereida sp. MMG025]|uniref:cobalamin biosynthesis protein CobQ n=1 Tax=Nereida sp. MMG025 TaxID=2909981 RepID=UPI001F3ECC34|nr:cobalamin biosynthesis protein CobQ [Nereida sp. MMG025]MCF6445070.1 cobalamin biosynthesis protein CobQ [Nereida sp. MMG025]